MITDNLSNIAKYSEIPLYIKEFLNDMKFECGKHKINDTDFVNIEEYSTKSHEICFFETHKKYADIQFLVSGKERLDYVNPEQLSLKTPYDNEKDIVFWNCSETNVTSCYLDTSNFVLLLPDEPHRPQMNFSGCSHKVKKVVVKFIPI